MSAPPPTMRVPREEACRRVAVITAGRVVKQKGMPFGAEMGDMVAVAWGAAIDADARYDPSRGKWLTWVIGQARHALHEVYRNPHYGMPDRCGRCLVTTPLDALAGDDDLQLQDLLPDPHDEFEVLLARLEAQQTLAPAERVVRPRWWAVLEATFGADRSQADLAQDTGLSASRIMQLSAAARKAAREALSL